MGSVIEQVDRAGNGVVQDMLNESPEGVECFPADAPWVETDGQLSLVGGQCSHCSTRFFPKKEVCHACGTIGEVETMTLARSGALYAYSVVHVAPRGFATPYFIGYVDLDDGVRIFAQIDAADKRPEIGERMEFRIGEIRTRAEGKSVLSYRFRRSVA